MSKSFSYIARTFQASSEDNEISGQLFIAVVGTLHDASLLPLREKYGFTEIDPEAWYSLQTVLDFLKSVEETLTYEGMVAIGLNTPGIEVSEEKTLAEALNDIVALIPRTHRNIPQDFGYHIVTDLTITRIICNVPYPSYLIYGWIYGLIRGYLKDKATDYIVRMDETLTPYEIIIEQLPPDDEA